MLRVARAWVSNVCRPSFAEFSTVTALRNCSIRCCSDCSSARAAFTSTAMLFATLAICCCVRACSLASCDRTATSSGFLGPLRHGQLRLPPGNGGGVGEKLRHHRGYEDGGQRARRRLSPERRLRLLQLPLLEGPVPRHFCELAADCVELLAIDGLRPSRVHPVAIRRFFAKSVLQAVSFDREVAGPHLRGKRCDLTLQPIMGALHCGEFLSHLEVEILFHDLVGDLRAQSRIMRGDVDAQQAGAHFIAEADLAAQGLRRRC